MITNDICSSYGMSRIYDNWEKLVGAVLRREKDRQLALCESFSTSSSVDFRSRFSFDSTVEDVGVDYFSSSFSFNPFAAADVFVPAVSRSSGPRVDPADPSSQHIFFFRNVMALDYEEIRKATKKFGSDTLLGEGAFGPVYKGWIHEHNLSAVKPGSGLAVAVAVKKLNLEGFQRHMEWLVGGHLLLPWATRIRVAVGAARALAFLHGLEIPVVNRNIKSHNILLDADFNPKLSDFGMARDGPTGYDTHVTTRVMGTYGYAAPEYIATGYLTTRCDVYGFGVVLLELLSGLRVIDTKRPKEKHNLLKWAVPYFKDIRKLPQIIDSRLEGEYPREEAHTVGKLALQCVSSDPRLRPNMSEVVAALEAL